ncbi:hypothetical protein FACS1894142_4960 [Spirochaetia bacterium]|nr:hypothetical protein FACS1894142_4960 [Spirochaetia bacterium]
MATLKEKAKAIGAIELIMEEILIPNTHTSLNKIDNTVYDTPINTIKTIDRFKNAFRKQTDSERKELLDNIKVFGGIATPIKVWMRAIDNNDYECIIIDGHNRYEIAQMLGFKSVPVQYAEFVSEDDAYLFIVNEQLGRRNLSLDERHDLLSIKKQLLQQKPTFHGNQHIEVERQNGAPPKGKVAEQVATDNGVSPRTVERADKDRRDAIANLKNIGLSITEGIENQILKGEVNASTKDMETLASLEKETALKIFDNFVKTKVLTIPEEAKTHKKEVSMINPIEAKPNEPEKQPGCAYIDEGCEIIGEPDAILVKLCNYSMIVSFIKKHNAKYPFKGIAVVGGDDNDIKETYFLFGKITPVDRIFKNQEELKNTYNFVKVDTQLIWHAKPELDDVEFIDYIRTSGKKFNLAEQIREIIISSYSEEFKKNYWFLSESCKVKGRLAKTPKEQGDWMKEYFDLQKAAYGLGATFSESIKMRSVETS